MRISHFFEQAHQWMYKYFTTFIKEYVMIVLIEMDKGIFILSYLSFLEIYKFILHSLILFYLEFIKLMDYLNVLNILQIVNGYLQTLQISMINKTLLIMHFDNVTVKTFEISNLQQFDSALEDCPKHWIDKETIIYYFQKFILHSLHYLLQIFMLIQKYVHGKLLFEQQ